MSLAARTTATGTTTANPLLDFSGLPRFDAIRTEHVTPAVDDLLAAARGTIEAVATAPGAPAWDTLVEPLTESLDRLQRAWGAVQHLNAVVNTPELRDAYNANLPKIVAFYTDLGAGPAPLCEVPRTARRCSRVRRARRRETQAHRQRAARLPPGRRRA